MSKNKKKLKNYKKKQNFFTLFFHRDGDPPRTLFFHRGDGMRTQPERHVDPAAPAGSAGVEAPWGGHFPHHLLDGHHPCARTEAYAE